MGALPPKKSKSKFAPVTVVDAALMTLYTSPFLAAGGHGGCKAKLADRGQLANKPEPALMSAALMRNPNADTLHETINELVFGGNPEPLKSIFGLESAAT